MNARQYKSICFILLISLQDVFCVHYWRISDDGKKIEASEDSPYTLAYPGSLVAFMKQQEHIKTFGTSFVELRKTLNSISDREKKDDPEIETKVRAENKDCQLAKGFKTMQKNYQTSYSTEICDEYHFINDEYIAYVISKFDEAKSDAAAERPLCARWHPKGLFSVETEKQNFDKFSLAALDGISDRESVDVLDGYFLEFLGGINRFKPKFVHALAYLLASKDHNISAHPYLHLAAAAYWRATGKAQRAYECYKTAAYYINEPQLDLFEGATVHLEDAVHMAAATMMLQAGHMTPCIKLLNYFRNLPTPLAGRPICTIIMVHASSGDVGTQISMYDGSLSKDQRYIVDFEAALSLREAVPESMSMEEDNRWRRLMDLIATKLAAIKCQIAMTEQLMFMKDNLEKLIVEKQHFNDVYGTQMKAEEQISQRISGPEDRQFYRLSYDMAKYGWNPHRVCHSTMVRRFPLSSNPNSVARALLCEVNNMSAYEESMAALRKATLKNRPPLNDTAWRVAELFTRDRVFDKNIQQLRGTAPTKPQLPPKYPLDRSSLSSVRDRFWRRADWPNSVDCQAIVSRTDIFHGSSLPQIFISPENKGFIVSDYLTKAIGLEHNEDHPLPWNEPYCPDIGNIKMHPLSTFMGVLEIMNSTGSKAEWAESRLKTRFVRMADRIMDDIEIAQRISTMLNNNIGPRWLSLNLAGLYWRIKGNPRQAALCLIDAVTDTPSLSDIALSQLSQVLFRATGRREEAIHMLQMADGVDSAQPLIPWLQGRLSLLGLEVDAAVRYFKEALDRDPFNTVIAEDLLKVACSGKSSKPAISARFPTVCCSAVVQNAVCFKKNGQKEQCHVVDPESGKLIYHRCNGEYTGSSDVTAPYVHIVSPLLPIFHTASKKDMPPFADDVGGVQTIETEELPLDYGGSEAFFAARPAEWWTRAKNEMRYERRSEANEDEWTEEWESDLAILPPKPLSFLWIKDKSEMLRFDIRLPSVLPSPSLHQIRKGLSRFPPPRPNQMCSGVNKLSVLLENQVSTWVSVTAKGEDIEKYVDLRGPVPGIAGLLPNCPRIEKTDGSPLLGLDHIPAFALSDQFLFYKPEKMLTDALKSLGNERDSIEHVAARLHTALLADGMGQNGHPVNWLLCVLSSLYWRVVGDAPKAVGCLRCALQTAPPHMRDVALVSLANICHQAGLLHSALIAAGSALSASPNLVAIHFTIANIYASIGDYQKALEFYYSTLSLQSNFEPAKERIRAIYCHSGETFTFSAV